MYRERRNGVVLELGFLKGRSQSMFVCWPYWSRKHGENSWCGKERKITGVLHLKTRVLDLVRKNGRIAFDRNLDSSSIIINEKLDMTTNRSELIARCGNESLKNSLLTPFLFFPLWNRKQKYQPSNRMGEKKMMKVWRKEKIKGEGIKLSWRIGTRKMSWFLGSISLNLIDLSQLWRTD